MESKLVTILFVVLGVALVFAPVYWIMPSPRQKQLARLRAYALQLGLRPAQRSVPAVLQRSGYPATMIKYQWFKPDSDWPDDGPAWLAFVDHDDGRGGSFEWLRSKGYSRGSDSLLASLGEADFPRQLGAFEADSSGVGVYWHEAGDQSQVDRLYKILKDWSTVYIDAANRGWEEPNPA